MMMMGGGEGRERPTKDKNESNMPKSYFLQQEKSTLSLWKLITFYHDKQIWPNKLINLKQSNCDNTKFVWV